MNQERIEVTTHFHDDESTYSVGRGENHEHSIHRVKDIAELSLLNMRIRGGEQPVKTIQYEGNDVGRIMADHKFVYRLANGALLSDATEADLAGDHIDVYAEEVS